MILYLELLWEILRLALAILALISLVSCDYSIGALLFKLIVGETDEMVLFLPYRATLSNEHEHGSNPLEMPRNVLLNAAATSM